MHNVISGSFKIAGQTDWAVLCLDKHHSSSIIVYWNGRVEGAYQFGRMDETIGPYKNGYYRFLAVADAAFIKKFSSRAQSTVPAVVDHHGIEDGIAEKGSLVHYLHRGKWLKLGGTD